MSKKISDKYEPQMRQILKHYVNNGIISEEVFKPRTCDRNFISLARAVNYKNQPMAQLAVAEQSTYNNIPNKSAASIGVCAITQLEFHSVHSALDVYESPSPNIPNHSKVDFSKITNEDDVIFELSEMAAGNVIIKNW